MITNPLSPYFKFNSDQKRKSEILCARGEIKHLLTIEQRKFYDAYKTGDHRSLAMICSRKVGKSWLLFMIVRAYCLSNPNSRVLLCAPSLREIRDIFHPLLLETNQYFPKNTWPRILKTENKIIFSNGSIISLASLNKDHVESLRGPRADLCAIDEAMFCDTSIFDYAVKSIILPQMLFSKNPCIIYTSTMAEDINHVFVTDYIPELKQREAYFTYTIWENSLLSKETKLQLLSEYGDESNNQWRREYLAELIGSETLLLVPEFNKVLHILDNTLPLDITEEPTYYKPYISGDCGLVDFTHILTGYHDTDRNILFIDNEWADNYKTLTDIAEAWKVLHTEISILNKDEYAVDGVLDIFDIAAHTLKVEHSLVFRRPSKSKEQDAISLLRNLFKNDKIRINSRCTKLISQLESCIWGDDDKISRNNGTHADGLMALIYMCRIVPFNRKQRNINLNNSTASTMKNASSIINKRRLS